MYKDLVEYLVKSLVDNKEQVVVSLTETDNKKIITVKVPEAEMGRVIGKDGRIIKSIREIVRAYGAKNKETVLVEVEE